MSPAKSTCFYKIKSHLVRSRFSLQRSPFNSMLIHSIVKNFKSESRERSPVNSTLVHLIVTQILRWKVVNKAWRKKFPFLLLWF